MQNQAILYGVIGLLAGSLLTLLFATSAVNSNNMGMMRMMGMRPVYQARQEMMQEEIKEEGMHMGSSMSEMMDSLEGKTGDAFDQAFISAMIVHHQGAIEMAEKAKENAEHQEIKDLAEAIISAQTSEIELMKLWQESWGYK